MIPLEYVIPQTNYIISFGQELFFSLGVMSTVFVYLGFCLPRIAASHELKSEKFLRQESYYKITFEFIYKMALLALTQMGAIFIWGGAIYILDFPSRRRCLFCLRVAVILPWAFSQTPSQQDGNLFH